MASVDPVEQHSSDELTEEAKKLAELKKAAEGADARDEEIEKAIFAAFKTTTERLTIERVNNLKTVLSDIVEAQIEAQKNKQIFNLEYFIHIISRKEKNTIDIPRLTALKAIFGLLKMTVERGAVPEGEEKEAKEDIKVVADNSSKI